MFKFIKIICSNSFGNAPYKHETDYIENKKLARVNSESLMILIIYYCLDKVIIGPYNIVTGNKIYNIFVILGPYKNHQRYPHLVDEF